MPVDALGQIYAPTLSPQRVVSLVPSLTESLFELGAGADLIGISDFCLFPAEGLAGLPRLGGTKTPDLEALRLLRPDLVYLNLEENLRRHGEAIAKFSTTFVTEPKDITGVIHLLRSLGEIHSRSSDALVDRIEKELVSCSTIAPFTFAVPIWKRPWMWCGGDTYVSNLVAAAGGNNVLAHLDRYPTLEAEEIASLRPDVIFLPDEPYLFTEADHAQLSKLFEGRIVGPFPGHLFTWHGSRSLLGLRFLREVFEVPA
ncbi:MAG TPA: helical backbone metal receptor [Thermoanaerobaculia bacterium]|nr:helical backbone metal receptor [Thermoanaerobaculia bacterium]